MRTFPIRILLLLLVVAPINAEQSVDLLDMHAGAVILSHPGQYNKDWPAMGMIDGTTEVGWASTKQKPLPHHVTIELARTYAVHSLAVDNTNTDEDDFPLTSAREVAFYGAVDSRHGGYQHLGTIMAKRGGRASMQLAAPVAVRWMRIEIRSNYGNARFTELMELEAYGLPVGPAPVQPDPGGHFVTNWEMMQLRTDGEKLSGCYDLDSGYLQGTTDGRVLDFRWVEHGGGEVGEAVMVLSSSGNFLNGLWYEQGQLKGVWFGNRELSGNTTECDIDNAAANLAGVLINSTGADK